MFKSLKSVKDLRRPGTLLHQELVEQLTNDLECHFQIIPERT